MVLQRNEPFCGNTHDPGSIPHDRLQILSGSMNMFAYPILARFFNTSLVLRMIEHNKYPSDLELSSPVDYVLRTASGAKGLHAPLNFKHKNKTITAPEFQYELMSAAAEYGRQHGAPAYEIELAELSAEIAADIPDESTHTRWQGHVEHIGKYAYLQHYLDKTGIDISHTKAIGFDLLWNNVSIGGIVAALRKQGKIALMPDEASIAAAKQTAPDPTRARLRGRLLDYITKNGLHYSCSKNWHFVKTYDKKSNPYYFNMDDPWNYAQYPSWYNGPTD
jgi:proteasome accessory factor A